MATYSKKTSKKPSRPVPSLARGTYLKAYVRVTAPPEVQKWQRGGAEDVPYRQVSQERAAEITGKSAHTVRRWANDHQPVDITSMRLLQVWVWGIIPAAEFIEAGIFIAHHQRWHHSGADTVIATDNGYLISVADLQSFGWLQGFYRDQAKASDKAAAAEALAAIPSAQIIPFSEYLARRRPPSAPDKDHA